MKTTWLRIFTLVFVLLPLGGCAAGGAGGNMDGQIPLSTAQETVPVRGEDILGVSADWTPNQQVSVEWGDISGAERAAQEAISGNSERLAAVDYVELSLPRFVTQTRELQLKPSDFTGRGVRIDAHGVDKLGGKWLLYEWQGPEFPQGDAPEIVHRWVYTYALYDVENKRITRLVATIRGVVYE